MMPPARLLDITRTLRRAGRIPTGIDRVERAYLRALLDADVPTFGLARTRYGYLLFDEAGLARLELILDAPNLLGAARRAACARTVPFGLRRMLRRALPAGVSYLNVGHSNITQRVLDAVKTGCDGVISVFLHDVIPLDFPHLQRAGTAEAFGKKIDLTARYADHVIANSIDTLARARRFCEPPRETVAHLGVDLVDPIPLPNARRPRGAYFLAVGTIEPRKNHTLLLDVWEDLGPEAPTLVICGARGWADQIVFDRIDKAKATGRVIEHNDLSDAEIASLMEGAQALLFPSLAEGFGLPAIEAAARGVPVIASDLSVLKEVLRNIPIYASITDRYLWTKYVKEYATADPKHGIHPFQPPTWQAHFKTVLSVA